MNWFKGAKGWGDSLPVAIEIEIGHLLVNFCGLEMNYLSKELENAVNSCGTPNATNLQCWKIYETIFLCN